jgi:hypothetical protein
MGWFLTRPESRFGDKKPFSMAKMVMPDPLVGIIGISFTFEEYDPDGCSMILSLHAFQRIYFSLSENQPDRDVFEWDEWGPSATRWLPSSKVEPAGIRSICGPRMLVRGRPSALAEGASNNYSLMILDFNPRPIRRGATSKCEDTYEVLVVDHETEWQDGNSDLKITSRLPFRAFVSQSYSRGAFYCFDGSNIVIRMVRMGLGIRCVFHRLTDLNLVWNRDFSLLSSSHG